MLEPGKDMDPQSCKILQTFVWWGAQTRFTIQTSVKFCDFADRYLCQFPTYNSQNLLILTCSFQWCRWIFAKYSASKVKKNMEGSIDYSTDDLSRFNTSRHCLRQIKLIWVYWTCVLSSAHLLMSIYWSATLRFEFSLSVALG